MQGGWDDMGEVDVVCKEGGMIWVRRQLCARRVG